MNWENKTKMCQLGNKMNNTDESIEVKNEFQKFVTDHIETFDDQAWDMFVTIIEILPNQMQAEIEFWKKVYSLLKNVDLSKFSFRTGLRMSLIQQICVEELKFND